MARPFILNADDYGMDAAVDRAILDLAARRIVTATSAMVFSPFWPWAARDVRGGFLDCGLHLDFTSPFAAGIAPARSLPALISRAFTRRLDPAGVRIAIREQLARFEDAMDRPPRFVDGHQHVHQLPVIREALFDMLQERYGPAAARVAVRVCLPGAWRGVKAAAVRAVGARALAELAAARGHPANSDFAGIYDLSPKADLPVLWRRWLAGLRGAAPLIMCHVALPPEDSVAVDDPVRPARLWEYAWLTSGAFQDLLGECEAVPTRWAYRCTTSPVNITS